ncbi:MAG: peptidase C39 family protein [Caldilineaceae bacterium]|nr:peptidase C39 family protein [Caldilineaceae bacterium]
MSSSLSVPHFPQQADGYCLPACVQMVMAYWGIDRDQSKLARELRTIVGAGTPGSRLLHLASRSLDVHYGEGVIDDLRSALNQGIPPIVLVNTMHFPHWQLQTAHAVVITDMGEAEVLMNDPGVEHGPISVSFGDFYLAWDEMANLYGLIRKK